MTKPESSNVKVNTKPHGNNMTNQVISNPLTKNPSINSSFHPKDYKIAETKLYMVKAHHPSVAGKTLPTMVNPSRKNLENTECNIALARASVGSNSNSLSTLGESSQSVRKLNPQAEYNESRKSVNFTQAGRREKESRSSNGPLNRIPATKFLISQVASRTFANPKSLAEEIIRHKNIDKKFI